MWVRWKPVPDLTAAERSERRIDLSHWWACPAAAGLRPGSTSLNISYLSGLSVAAQI